MILVTEITPAALGLTWGASRKQCLETLNVSPVRETPIGLVVDLALQETVCQVSLRFDEQQGLEIIEVILRESGWFWEDRTMEELEATHKEYQTYYQDLARLHRETLGAPDFSGYWKEEGFPEPKYAMNTHELTYWNRPGERVQIGWGQEDRETPVFVEMACYRM